jgi:hypothetical protein
MVKFEATVEELQTIMNIVERAAQHWTPAQYPPQDMMMDLDACHSNGCPLDLAKLLRAPDFDFVHDVAGIFRHIDRSTGKIQDCFLPRCSK